MYQLTVSFNTEEELLAYIEARAKQAAGETEKPKPTRKRTTTTETTTTTPATAAPATAVDPGNILGLPGAAAPSFDSILGLGNSSAQLPPVATAAPAALPAAAPPAPAAPSAPSQQDVIRLLVQLGQTPGKGVDAVKHVLAPFQVSTVTAIKTEHNGFAMKAAQAALAAPTLADVAAAVKAALGQK